MWNHKPCCCKLFLPSHVAGCIGSVTVGVSSSLHQKTVDVHRMILETVASHRLSRYRRRLRYRLGPKVSLVRILHFGSMIHYFLLLTNRSMFSCLDLGPCSEDSSSAATRLLGALHSKSSGVALQADRIPTHLGAASAVEPEEPRRSGDLWILFSFILQPGCPTTEDQIKIKCRSCCCYLRWDSDEIIDHLLIDKM